MAKYKITVENMEPGADWPENENIYCEGFTIISDQGDSTETAIHNMSVMDIAEAIDGSPHLRSASALVMMVDAANAAKNGVT